MSVSASAGVVAGVTTAYLIEQSDNREVSIGLERCRLADTKQESIACIDKLEQDVRDSNFHDGVGLLVVTLLFVGFGWWVTR